MRMRVSYLIIMHVKILRDYGSFLKHFSGARWPKTNSEPGHVPGLAGPTKALIWWASVEEKKLLSELFRVSQPSLQTAPVGLALVLFVSITSPVTGRGNNGLRFSSHSRQLSFGRWTLNKPYLVPNQVCFYESCSLRHAYPYCYGYGDGTQRWK